MVERHDDIARPDPLDATPHPAEALRKTLTKLDFFAAAAMHSLLLADKGISTDRLAIDAYNIAEAMAARGELLSQRARAPQHQRGAHAHAGVARASPMPVDR